MLRLDRRLFGLAKQVGGWGGWKGREVGASYFPLLLLRGYALQVTEPSKRDSGGLLVNLCFLLSFMGGIFSSPKGTFRRGFGNWGGVKGFFFF